MLRAYRPHLYAPPAAAAARAQMERAWPAVLDAIASLVADADAWHGGRDGAQSAASAAGGGVADGGGGGAPIVARPHSEDFEVLLGLCVHRLTEAHADAVHATDGAAPEPEACVRCLAALERLLLPGSYLAPAALPPAALLSLLRLLEARPDLAIPPAAALALSPSPSPSPNPPSRPALALAPAVAVALTCSRRSRPRRARRAPRASPWPRSPRTWPPTSGRT